MLVGRACEHQRRRDARLAVQRDAVVGRAGQPLQPVHPVRDRDAAGTEPAVVERDVPRGARLRLARQQRGVGVHDRPRCASSGCGRAQPARRRTGSPSSASASFGCVATTTRSKRSTAASPARRSTPSTLRRSSRTGAPSRTLPRKRASSASTYRRDPPSTVRQSGASRRPSSPWFSKKPRKNAGRHRAHVVGRRRPDRRAHRCDEVPLEAAPVAALVQEVADRAPLPARIGERALARAEEAADVGEQAQEARAAACSCARRRGRLRRGRRTRAGSDGRSRRTTCPTRASRRRARRAGRRGPGSCARCRR